LFANDFDHKKGRIYRDNWGADELKIEDVRTIMIDDLPGRADLVWGAGAGLRGDRSGTFWPFWTLMKTLIEHDRSPRLIVLENVCGTLTSHEGRDFAAICTALQQASYRPGAIVMDASLFVPQSRARLFIVAVRNDVEVPPSLVGIAPSLTWHSRALQAAYFKLAPKLKQNWIWWDIPVPAQRNLSFADLIEDNPPDVSWHTPEETNDLLAMMSDINLAKVDAAKKAGKRTVGCIYKRTRKNGHGKKVQRAEVRFDDVAGCLRTPAGGSSRQLILVVERNVVKSRLISGRETARLMGLSDEYRLPKNYNETYHLTGDGVVVPVVRHLASQLLERILAPSPKEARQAA
jgi:DNA (cytosine-5)-methyltransferase 1